MKCLVLRLNHFKVVSTMKKCEECKRNISSHKFSEMNIGGRGYMINLNKLLKDNTTDEAKGKVLFQ